VSLEGSLFLLRSVRLSSLVDHWWRYKTGCLVDTCLEVTGKFNFRVRMLRDRVKHNFTPIN
jgi:hypothetical protein